MIYSQSTGRLTTEIGSLIGFGYAGYGQGKNNPKMQSVHDVGPLPVGKYFIGEPYVSKNTGPFTIPLNPDPANEMFDRSDFKIHGDTIDAPGTASHGCIIMALKFRQAVHTCTDKILNVIP
jgi:hypothetical protein